MKRKAFLMRVHPGRDEEYRKRHNPIWPELEAVLKSHGVRTYSIFLQPGTGELFAYAEIDDEAEWRAIARTRVCRRWWRHMSDIMPTNPDHSPRVTDLVEVFHIEQDNTKRGAKRTRPAASRRGPARIRGGRIP